MKAILFARCSTQEQNKSHLGLDAQIAEMERFCKVMGIEVIGKREEVVSGTSPKHRRPILNATLDDAHKLGAVVMFQRIDRMARCHRIVSDIVTGNNVVVVECGLNASPLEIQLRASFSEEEARKISQRTSAALKMRREKGLPMGFMHGEDIRQKSLAAAAKAKSDEADRFAAQVKSTLLGLKKSGMTLQQIADSLNQSKTPTFRGGKSQWYPATVSNVLKRISA
jgi:DNA invertase Pin-like site-specific DNA recombinase